MRRHTSHRSCGTGVVAAIVISLAIAVSAEAADRERPSFLVILCDDLGYGDLGCYGHPAIRTPNLDHLAAQGIRLTSCYAAAPVCSPSRAGLLTGRNPNWMGIYDWIPAGSPMHLRRGQVTIAGLLKQAGYATCQVGKWHLNGQFNSPKQPQPGDHGFAHWMSTQNNAAPSHENPVNFVRNGEPTGQIEGFSCQIVTDEAIRWLRTIRPTDRPFFQFVCFHEPHEPIASPPELVAKYDPQANPDRAQYHANVTNVDVAVGRLMAALDELHLADDTFVLFTSDNGPETLTRYPRANRSYGSPGPLRGMKLHIYEGGIRVPGIIRWPGRAAAGRIEDQPICSTDLLPTFCEMAGIDPPRDHSIDGTSILPLLSGGPIARETPLFWFYCLAMSEPKLAMRDGDWKLCAHWDLKPRDLKGPADPETTEAIKRARLTDFELYNLRQDIGEKHDLAAREPARVKEMADRLSALFGGVQQECPVWGAPAASNAGGR